MDLSLSHDDLIFRDEVRAWIAENYDDGLRAKMAQSKNGYLDREGQVAWQKKLYGRGWMAPDWPVEYGGAGFTPSQRYIFSVELASAGCPISIPMGPKMVAPVIMAFGTPEQKAEHLPPILSSDRLWCQGYSEPGSGSDLASLQMRAERDGDRYVLNGSKIWTTHAQWADWMFCLVRTSREDKPQKGISFLLLDMKTPGISVRPLPTLDVPAEGQQEINQVFFENVCVPAKNRIGEEGKGWTYAKYLLEFERASAYAPGLRRSLKNVRDIALREGLIEDEGFRRKLSGLEVRIDVLNAVELRIFSAMISGEPAGPASSMLKCAGTELQQAIGELAVEAIGYYAMPFAQDTWAELRGEINEPRHGPDYAAPVAPSYFNFRKASIYGGTNEVQRNIMAKLVLGL